MVVVREQITDTWRKIIQNTSGRQGKPWVVFRHGTCVILMEGASSKEDAAAKATQIISEYGPVWIATSSADFNVTENSAAEGMIVTCWHNDVLSFVGKDEEGILTCWKRLSLEGAKEMKMDEIQRFCMWNTKAKELHNNLKK